jgi:hypothetical protein
VTPVYQNATVSSAPESAGAVKSLQGETQEGNRPADLGPSFIVGAQSPQKSVSLGEVAASYKAMGRSRNVRVYANTD